jgi:predicted AAA+ superfamily ATPase
LTGKTRTFNIRHSIYVISSYYIIACKIHFFFLDLHKYRGKFICMKYERLLKAHLLSSAGQFPVVTVVGPRQSGKTTLVRDVFPQKTYRSLENPDVRAYATDDPRGFLDELDGGAILDEVQRVPQLLSYLQQRVDENNEPGRFILTGSQHFLLMENISQSLAGRTAVLTLLPLSIPELAGTAKPSAMEELIWKGFYPRVHERPVDPYAALRDYFQTYVERDVRQLLKVHDLLVFETFVRLCAGRVGQLLNLTSLANDAGISAATAKEWIRILEASFVLFRMAPWHANISKRLVKTPKLYFHDVGLAAYLCGVEDSRQVLTHPLRGNLFENMVVADLLKRRFNNGRDSRLCFFRDQAGNEVNLLFPDGSRFLPIEIKSGKTVHLDWFTAFEQFAKVRSESAAPAMVVYGGDQIQRRSAGILCGVWQMDQVLNEILADPS